MDDTESLDSYAEQGLLLKYIGPGPNKPTGKLTYIAGGGVDEARVTLRFFGAHLDPDVLTQTLGCQPTTARRKGEIVREHWIATTGVWFCRQARSDESLPSQIQQLFDCLPDAQAVWDDLQQFAGELSCGLWCRTWNRGLDLPLELLQQIAARHLSVSLDMYFEPEDDEQDEA